MYIPVSSQTAFAIFLVHSVLESAKVRIDNKDGVIRSQCRTRTQCSKRSYSLLRDMLPPLETLVVTVQGSGGLDGVSSLLIT